MIARRTAIFAGALLLGMTSLQAGTPVEADPHELYEKARENLADGELRAAASSLSRLTALIAKRPDWDPEGVFAKELLPPLQGRLARLQTVAHKLDDFTVQALQDLQPPDLKKDISTVRDYTEWATTVIQRLRGERDGIVADGLTDPEERAFLTHTESYERTERLLEVDVLKRMADTAGDDILGLLAGDPELEAVLVRFRQLKRDLMQMVSDKAALEKDVTTSRVQNEALLGVLGVVVTDDFTSRTGTGGRRHPGVAELFPHFLDSELEALHRRTYATPGERDLLRANLDRYRRYNKALRAAGIGQDQGDRIESLQKAVDALPIDGGVLGAVSSVSPLSLLLIGALALAAGSLGWLAIARGRAIASLRPRGEAHVPRISARVRDTDAGRKVV